MGEQICGRGARVEITLSWKRQVVVVVVMQYSDIFVQVVVRGLHNHTLEIGDRPSHLLRVMADFL